ncbi:UDP-N-acetylglucosamine--N-acetylmuramyl-(pentapeptide) pyrophosphoryl-undecaprenol N-acetylglucosamine transferase [bacterium BMS3Bbin05]|nr:UDP-N-acetylglucosamine--N-acetylmuramyl-(pentapeptide) pyrophosphoryl-undecaprenol N-acetylglucosamine transferase [bacterium BMS3Bbin05]HDL20316.1 undecaprenyldiphospho-muramoylpentapeptide beta-N-acetylglucosaminyltransferase [Nitrospirota bacterium]HDO21855.1 undecaprenyldiphospho-muramoylpentapeptide beta-N-acetylglucosaminyltransferase [Nitrospirota bacterium]HDZ87317.1 undecaprenyldiphospho-muramoylpentapeptide beta-N-acetylglucosaminyltransferase [Nitrospirota bacterium]
MKEGGPVKIIIAGGGTGGHLFPGIALAEEFMKNRKADKIIFVGTDHGIEASVIPREGFTLEFVRAEGLVGKSIYKKIRAAFYLLLAMVDSCRIIRKYRPDMIVGSGGYASFTTVFAGLFLTTPTLILEQNSRPGLANRILGRFADMVCVAYHESISFFPKNRTYLTGNPVRERVLRGSRVSALKLFGLDENKFTVLVFGGSHGASSINKAMIDALKYLPDMRTHLQFLHQTGEKDYEFVRNAYRNSGFSGMIVQFIFQMAEAYAVSDLVVSRAGATTLAELTAIGKPSILIPYPYAAGNHQELNARKMEQMAAAFMIIDRELNGRKLADMIRELYTNEKVRKTIQQNSLALGQRHAAEKVFALASSLLSRKSESSV